MTFGASYLGDNRTRFRLWAPGVRALALEIDGQRSLPMTAQSDGWFEVEATCGPGAAYRYRLPSGEAFPDPASRAQVDDVHGPSIVVDPKAYCWRHPDWKGRPWHETVLYELHAGSCGGFAGVRADLDRLGALGITAIELMPVSDFSGKRNWGYDGVLPYAPDRAYGTPDELRALVDAAHGRGLMMFLDVVYNHFGPDGNYLGLYAPQFFRTDIGTPWGAAIDFRQPAVRRYFIENALHWLGEYRFDGLRFDAVHAIADQEWLDEMAGEIRATIKGRHVHLVLEHDGNEAAHLRRGFDAQWNDDAHHALHVLLTGERDGYYRDYAEAPARQLARCLAEGFAFQGEPSAHRKGERRGTPSADLPPTAFVLFLQNHDQIGNRPFGDRLIETVHPEALRAAVALQLLSPNIPLLFMGEERMSRAPFQFFTDFQGDLAKAVCEGRRREFASFTRFGGQDIPDPNAPQTFERSRVAAAGDDRLHRRLLKVRRDAIMQRLAGTKSLGAQPIGDAAVAARWRMGDGAVLALAANLGEQACDIDLPRGDCLFASRDGALDGTRLGGRSTVAFLQPAP